jgi:hypothetical protein
MHNCQYTFAELSREVMPRLMVTLRKKLKHPLPLVRFCTTGKGLKTLLREFSNGEDFSGCYIFVERGRPFYVGISKAIIRRIRSHVTARNHNGSSLVYAMANRSSKIAHYRKTTGAKRYQKPFFAALKKLRTCNVAFIRVDNPLVLYIFEAYAALHFDTQEWNSFVTH